MSKEADSVDISEYIHGTHKRQERSNEIEELSFNNSIANLINNPDFAVFIKFLLDKTNFNGNNYSTDKEQLSFLTAKRDVFLDVLFVLDEVDPEYYPRLLMQIVKGRVK